MFLFLSRSFKYSYLVFYTKVARCMIAIIFEDNSIRKRSRLHEINLLLDENYHTVPIIYRHLYIDCIFTPCNVPKYQELHGRKVIMCLSLNQSVALMPSCIDVTILCRNNINQYSLYASKLSAGTIFIKGQYSSQYMAQKRNLSIYYFKLKKY